MVLRRIDKEYFPLEEVVAEWQLPKFDLLYLVETGGLRLSIRIMRVNVEQGEHETIDREVSVRIPSGIADGEVTVLAELPKRVDWDQHELGQLIERIKGEGDDPREYVEVSLKVSERKYTAWPLHIHKLFEPARTVRTGAQSFLLILNKEDVQ